MRGLVGMPFAVDEALKPVGTGHPCLMLNLHVHKPVIFNFNSPLNLQDEIFQFF
jgi:hypothetical protein